MSEFQWFLTHLKDFLGVFLSENLLEILLSELLEGVTGEEGLAVLGLAGVLVEFDCAVVEFFSGARRWNTIILLERPCTILQQLLTAQGQPHYIYIRLLQLILYIDLWLNRVHNNGLLNLHFLFSAEWIKILFWFLYFLCFLGTLHAFLSIFSSFLE